MNINDSILSIFKLGPGPSSSHTIAPMLAGNKFINTHPTLTKIDIHFYGSLSLTGKGHGSDKAAVAGLLGERPENCDISKLHAISFDENYCFNEDNWQIKCIFHNEQHDFPYQNTIEFSSGNISERYYSIGGGFLLDAKKIDEPKTTTILPYRYCSMDTFKRVIEKYNISPVEALIENENYLNKGVNVKEKLDTILTAMLNGVERGLNTTGTLPGELKVERRSNGVYQSIKNPNKGVFFNEGMLLIDAFALAASEENAAGNLVVTAPTSGASGVIPGIIYYLINHLNVSREKIIDGLIIAGLIGILARNNASISGAEVGCQGEIGVAAAMGAALLAQINNEDINCIERSAEIALEHYLGLSCDPIGGYVQIPCIERNAVAANAACNAYLLARYSKTHDSKVTLDEAFTAMLQTGKHMSNAYKETSLGGLAKCSCCM